MFSPETLAYLNRKVNDALAAASSPASTVRKKKQAELARVRTKLDNIKTAIEQDILTPTTKTMLEEAEQRVAELEAAIQGPAEGRKVVYLPSVVEACLIDLKGPLESDPDHARSLLARLVGQVTLRRDGDHLIAELKGNLPGILDLNCDNPGAGRGI